MKFDAVGKRVIVKVLQDKGGDSIIQRAETQGARSRGIIISVGSEAKEVEPKLERGQFIMFYTQPTFVENGDTLSEFDYTKIVGILGTEESTVKYGEVDELLSNWSR